MNPQASSTMHRLCSARQARIRLVELILALVVCVWLATMLAPAIKTSRAQPESRMTALVGTDTCHDHLVGGVSLLDGHCAPIPADTHASDYCVSQCAPVLGAPLLGLWATLLVAHGLALSAHIRGARLNHPPLTPPPQLALG